MDTTEEADRVYIAVLRKMGPARRLQIAMERTEAVREMIRAQIAQDHPGLTDAERHRLFADRWLGPGLAAKVYGPLPKV